MCFKCGTAAFILEDFVKDIYPCYDNNNNMKEKIIRFAVYGFLGWCLEIIWTGVGSFINGNYLLYSFTYMWMFFIYGIGVFFEPIHNKIRKCNIFLRGGIWVLIIFAIEYFCGWSLASILGHCPWDYGDGVLSISGFIRLDFIVPWFFTGLLFEKIHDFLISIENLPIINKNRIN